VPFLVADINQQGEGVKTMARKIRSDAKLGSVLKRAGLSKSALKTKTGRTVRKDAKVSTLRKRSGK
jgi:hypothetical protein